MAAEAGLRSRKKQQTRHLIFESARRLFAERGFDSVSVASVARAADVSEVTVFNYFPTKEDLFYGGMAFFEEELLDAVRRRLRGESVLAAFRRAVLDSSDRLTSRHSGEAVARAAKVIGASPSLVAREREIVERYTRQLGELLAEETGAAKDDVEPLGAAGALMGVHRALVDYRRKRVLAGERGSRLSRNFRSQAVAAFALLEMGLAAYAIKSFGAG